MKGFFRVLYVGRHRDDMEELAARAGQGDVEIHFTFEEEIGNIAPRMSTDFINVVLLDIHRTEGEALDLIRDICTKVTSVPVLILASISQMNLCHEALKIGVEDYLFRTELNWPLLLHAVTHSVMRHQARGALKDRVNELTSIWKEYMAILRGTPDGLCMLDRDWRIRCANHALAHVLNPKGMTTQDLIGLPFSAVFPDMKSFQHYQAEIQNTINSVGIDIREIKLKHLDEDLFWARISIVKVDPAETAPGYVVTLTDISEQKRGEVERGGLQRLAHRLMSPMSLEELAEVLSCECRAVFEYDAFIFSVYNQETNELLVIRAEDTPEGDHTPVVISEIWDTPTDVEELAKTFSESRLINRSNNDVSKREHRFGYKDRISRSLMFVPVYLGIEGIGGVSVQSYTENKYCMKDLAILQTMAEQCGNALLRMMSEEELRAGEEKYRLLVENAQAAIISVDEAGRVLFINQFGGRLFGRQSREITGQNLCDLFPVETAEIMMTPIRQVRETGKSQYLEIPLVIQEEKRRCLVTLYFVPGGENMPDFIQIICHDIEEKRRLEEELACRQRLATIGETIAGVSHCMNNLVTVLNGGISLLERAGSESDWVLFKKAYDMVNRSSRRLHLLLMNMLEYSKVRGTNREDVDISQTFREVVWLLGNLHQTTQIRFEYEIQPEARFYFLDGQRLFRALLNLGVNAMDAMAEGGVLKFSARLVSPASAAKTCGFVAGQVPDNTASLLEVEVRDTGCGIPEENVPLLFDPFFSTKGSRGTGLGLASVKIFAEEHGGCIIVESTPGEGTSFRLVLP